MSHLSIKPKCPQSGRAQNQSTFLYNIPNVAGTENTTKTFT